MVEWNFVLSCARSPGDTSERRGAIIGAIRIVGTAETRQPPWVDTPAAATRLTDLSGPKNADPECGLEYERIACISSTDKTSFDTADPIIRGCGPVLRRDNRHELSREEQPGCLSCHADFLYAPLSRSEAARVTLSLPYYMSVTNSP